jgi:hypothetical protein
VLLLSTSYGFINLIIFLVWTKSSEEVMSGAGIPVLGGLGKTLRAGDAGSPLFASDAQGVGYAVDVVEPGGDQCDL